MGWRKSIPLWSKERVMKPVATYLDVPKTLFFVLAVTVQYLFFFLLLSLYLDYPAQAIFFAGVFVVLAGYYLFEMEIHRGLSAVVAVIRERPTLLYPVRIVLTLAVVASGLYGLYRLFPPIDVSVFVELRGLFIFLYVIDSVIVFFALAGEPGVKEMFRSQVTEAVAGADRIIRRVPIELFILSTFLSFALKALLVALIVVGVTGVIQISLYVILPWFLFSIFITALWLGSFGATFRYFGWVITAPPKAVVRNLFNMNTDALTCHHCEHTIPLVGVYECPRCKFKFKGQYFSWCPWCFSRFGYVNCPNQQCGLSRKRPLLY
jgi:hypothetical protein